MTTGAVCTQIRDAYARLTRCERRVADVVLANPRVALETATARLAEAAQVSQPQVIRFCRAVGFDGVKSLKRALADGVDAPPGHPLLARSAHALSGLDRATLTRAAETLAGAAQIDVLADAGHAPLRDVALHGLWQAGLPARPLLRGDLPPAARPAVCLALGSAAPPPPGAAGIWITEFAQAHAALQLVTGPESNLAPALLATLALQLLLADVAAARLGRRPAGPN